MNRLVMIADIIDSRQLINRGAIQQGLESMLGVLNHQNSQLLSPYTITLGDEFQAVFSGADQLFPDILAIMRQLHPVELRFALGVGPLSTAINPEQAIGMDGPAFHQARDLLTSMKHDSRTLAITGLPQDDGLQEAALGLFNLQLRKWRPNRLEILQRLLEDQDLPEIARHLDITERSVYKNIREGGLEHAIQLTQALTRRMNDALARTD
ncbi:SatD family protein [Vreelandella utahensis]|uniref:SatD family protein n=1 Tax=Vreelandella halophila TaxID=86177 RepID=UPI000987D1E3|nr:SatD family protein [Halomonas utahensis]